MKITQFCKILICDIQLRVQALQAVSFSNELFLFHIFLNVEWRTVESLCILFQKTRDICIGLTLVQRRHQRLRRSCRRCTNVIQFFCVYWDVKIRLNEDKLKKRNRRKWEANVSNMTACSGSIWLMIDVSRDASVTIPVHAALVIFYLLGTEHSVTRTPTSTSHYVCNDQRFITVKNPVFTGTYSVLQNQKAVIVYILSRRDCVLSLHDSFIHI